MNERKHEALENANTIELCGEGGEVESYLLPDKGWNNKTSYLFSPRGAPMAEGRLLLMMEEFEWSWLTSVS